MRANLNGTITDIKTNKWGEYVGTYNGRPVKFTYSTWMWYYTDTNEYIQLR